MEAGVSLTHLTKNVKALAILTTVAPTSINYLPKMTYTTSFEEMMNKKKRKGIARTLDFFSPAFVSRDLEDFLNIPCRQCLSNILDYFVTTVDYW